MKQYGCLILIVILSVAIGVIVWAGKVGRLRIALADVDWQPAVLKNFPIEKDAGQRLHAKLAAPVFARDADGGHLLLKCGLALRVKSGEGASNEALAGTVSIRSGVSLDGEGGQVVLAGCELVEFNLEGEAAATASDLREEVAAAVPVLLEGLPIYEVSRVKELGGWRGAVSGFIRSAVIENRQVTLVVGW